MKAGFTPFPVRRRLVLAAALLMLLALSGLACGTDGEIQPIGVELTRGNVTLEDEGWYCGSEVDIDRLEVTIRSEDVDAIHLANGCTGRIDEVRIVQYRRDGVKVSGGAHDLVIEGGTIECRAQKPGSHQDGIQVMGGNRIRFENIRVDCPTRSSGLFIRQGGRSSEPPTDILCVDCFIRGGGYSVRINTSVRSGIRMSTICAGRFGTLKVLDGAVNPVDTGNRFVSCS